jgi:DNA-binding MarR family transcriptional regulator
MAELGRLLNLDKSSMTGLVDRAERRGIVRRTHDPKDGRSYRIVLSEEGRRVAATLEGEVSKQIAALTAGLSDGEQEQLSLFASRIIIRSAADNGIDLTVSSS